MVRCTAVSKSTKKRCKRDACKGKKRCASHCTVKKTVKKTVKRTRRQKGGSCGCEAVPIVQAGG